MEYFLQFYSMGSQIWGQSNNHAIKKLQIVQNKALRTINFKHAQSSVNPLYKECKILKLADNIKLQNFLFAYDNLKNTYPPLLRIVFLLWIQYTYMRPEVLHINII